MAAECWPDVVQKAEKFCQHNESPSGGFFIMKKDRRIKKGYEFQEIIGKKQYAVNKAFVIYYRKKQQENARVGISVSKKMGNAVTRNKIKRQIRMIYQDMLTLSLQNDMICIVRNGYLKNTFAENKAMLEKLILKVNN